MATIDVPRAGQHERLVRGRGRHRHAHTRVITATYPVGGSTRRELLRETVVVPHGVPDR